MNSIGSRAAQSGICAVPIMPGYAKRESVWRVLSFERKRATNYRFENWKRLRAPF
jgi:hypothetical protein